MVTGFLARPTAKTSIGKVFQERAARYGDKVFIKFDDEQLTYREANETVNRYAAVLAARGVGHGDVVGVMSAQLAAFGAADARRGEVRRHRGMLNYHQRGKVLAHSIGLLDAKAVVAETDFIEPISESGADTDGLMTVDELQQLAATAPATNPAITAAVLAKDKAFYIFTSGTTGMPKASVMTHYRWLRALAGFGGLGHAADHRRHALLLPAALSQQRADGGAVLGAQLGIHAGAWQVVLGVEVLGRGHPLRRHGVRLHRRDLRLPAQPAAQAHRPQAPRQGDRRQRAAPGDLGRVHEAVRHPARLRVLRRQRGQHRLPQRLQRRQDDGHLSVAHRVRRIRRRDRRTGARGRRPGPQGQDRRAGAAAVEGEQLSAVRRLHRQGRHREEARSRCVQGR